MILKTSIGISIFGYESKEKYQIYVSKKIYEEKYVDAVLIGEEDKKDYLLIKDFNRFMYITSWKKYFCHYSLQCFSP